MDWNGASSGVNEGRGYLVGCADMLLQHKILLLLYWVLALYFGILYYKNVSFVIANDCCESQRGDYSWLALCIWR